MPKHASNHGFTLIEITMILVLLGILAAVAVPKFFDLQQEAEHKAVLSSAAEVQARLEATFAQKVLEGTPCSEARNYASNLIHLADDGAAGFGEFSFQTSGDASRDSALSLTYRRGGEGDWKNVAGFSLVLPQCSSEQSNASPTFSQAGLDMWKMLMDNTLVPGTSKNEEDDPYKFTSRNARDYITVQSQFKAALGGPEGDSDVCIHKWTSRNTIDKVSVEMGPVAAKNDNLLKDKPGADSENRNARIEVFKVHCANWETLFDIGTSAEGYHYLIPKYPAL